MFGCTEQRPKKKGFGELAQEQVALQASLERLQSMSRAMALADQQLSSMSQRLESCDQAAGTALDEANRVANRHDALEQAQHSTEGRLVALEERLGTLERGWCVDARGREAELEQAVREAGRRLSILEDAHRESMSSARKLATPLSSPVAAQLDNRKCFAEIERLGREVREVARRLDGVEAACQRSATAAAAAVPPAAVQVHSKPPESHADDRLHARFPEMERDLVRLQGKVQALEIFKRDWLAGLVDPLVSEPLRNLPTPRSDFVPTPRPLPEPELKELEDQSEQSQTQDSSDDYCLEESTWDVGIVLGLDRMCCGDSLLACVNIIASAATQFLLVQQMEYGGMTANPLDKAAFTNLRLWRLFQGHSLQNLDLASGSSLTSRICQGFTGNGIAGTQVSILDDLRLYLGDESRNGGFLLCLAAILLWFLMILKELRSLGRYARAVLRLRGPATRMVRQGGRDLVLQSVSSARAFLALALISLPRAGVAVCVGYVGTMYLVYTTAMNDLILNAIALGFILEIPAMFGAVLLPHHAKTIIAGLKPLPVSSPAKPGGGCRCSSLAPLASLVLLAGAVVATGYFGVIPFFERMEGAVDILCGHDTDFVFAYDKSSSLVISAPTTSWQGSSAFETGVQRYPYLSLLARSGLNASVDDEVKGQLFLDVPLDVLVNIGAMNTQESSNLNECIDILGTPQTAGLLQEQKDAFLNLFQLNFGVEASSCSQLKEYCRAKVPDDLVEQGVELIGYNSIMTAVRSMCPVSCGCDDPVSGIFILDGCTSKCTVPRRAESAALAQRHCTDYEVSELARIPEWEDFFEEFHTAMGVLIGINADIAQIAVADGCAVLNANTKLKSMLCSEFQQDPSLPMMGSVRNFCPETCGISNCTALPR